MHASAVPYQASSENAEPGLPVLPNVIQGSFRFRSAARPAAELHQLMSLPVYVPWTEIDIAWVSEPPE